MNHFDPKRVKIVFFGTPAFALPSLSALREAGYAVAGVVTRPDKSSGRHRYLRASAVKTYVLGHDLPVFQFSSLKKDEAYQTIAALSPDVMIVVAYGMLIPKALLQLPRHGILNLHPSLLPKYRGATPIPMSILNREKETGVTIMLLDEFMDHGPILAQTRVPLTEQITTPLLSDKLAIVGAELLLKILPDYLCGAIQPKIQDEAFASFTKLLTPNDGQILWEQKSAIEIDAQIRAFNPNPGTWCEWQGKYLKILETLLLSDQDTIISLSKSLLPGQFFYDDQKRLLVHCQTGVLEIKRLQPAGKKMMSSADFFHGYQRFLTHFSSTPRNSGV